MTRKIISLFLCVLMILSLSACGKGEDPAAAAPTEELIPGWLPEEVPVPEELGSLDTAWDARGDTLFLSSRGGEALIGCYDTLADSWTLLTADRAALPGPSAIRALSAADDTVWALLESRAAGSPQPDYWLFFCDTAQGSAGSLREIPFSGGETTEAAGLVFTGLYALDESRAILCAGEQGYVVDQDMNLLQTLPLEGCSFQSSLRAGEERLFDAGRMEGPNYVSGCCSFDPLSLRFSPMRDWACGGSFFSERGRFLGSVDGALCVLDPESGAVRETLFRWIDVALSRDSRGGYAILENSAGDFYYPVMGGKSLIRVRTGLVKARQTLVLGSFGHTPGGLRDRDYDLAGEVLDAVIRFNNTDPDYRVELRELTWETEGERMRLMAELATQGGVDILDTAGLPAGSLDSGLLLDLLPFLDADPDLSREDFIQPLLHSMLQKGALYELTPRVALLGLALPAGSFPGAENWTAEEAQRQLASMPQGRQLFPIWEDREIFLDAMVKMAAAELLDREAEECRFDSETYRSWLQLVKDAPYSTEYTEDPQLWYLSWDLGANAGLAIRMALQDDYVLCGLPGGSGPCFVPLGTGPDAYRTTVGAASRLGIPALSQNPEAAWRFVRLLLTQSGESSILNGIPVLRSSFEAALEASISPESVRGTPVFSEADAQALREAVYAAGKMACCDERLLSILKEEARACFEGQYSIEDAARRSQQRAMLWLAEQG